jgi:hypothetical protein
VIAEPQGILLDDDPLDVEGASAVAGYLARLHERHRANEGGEVATHIPELSQIDPALFGICIATVDGAVYEAGDTRAPLTIQSMSKPLTYALALERLGREAVHGRVGVEPSGDAFNELSISSETGIPRNPLINAGAITCSGLVASAADDPFALLHETYSRYAGRELEFDEPVYVSERDTGHRNRGMAHVLRGYGILDEPDDALDLYFRQCSISVECRALAVIAGDPRERRHEPADGRARGRRGSRARHAHRDGLVRHVRRRERVARHCRAAGQERGLRRRLRGAPGPPRDRRVLAARRPPGQLGARHRGLPRALARPRRAPRAAR